MSNCTQLMEMASGGVAPALRAIDCAAGEMTASAFGRLFGTSGALLPALTILLTLYIAFFALSLLTGRSSLGISALTPRMITLGVVLTFATSWVAYSQVLWNLAVAGPDWIAIVLTGSKGSASLIFADRIDIVFAAIEQASETATATATAATASGAPAPPASAGGMFKPADIMWLGALLLLLGTVGVLLTARIALALLMALGPLFLVLGLFSGTRGLTAGWLKGVALTALVPLFVVLGGAITLELLVPIISALSQSAEFGEISGRAAMALFLVAAVHVALMGMVLKVAGAIVSGWRVFGLASPRSSASRDVPFDGRSQLQTHMVAASDSQRAAPAASARSLGLPLEAAAMETPNGAAISSRDRSVTTVISGGGVATSPGAVQGRARGIGSRFRSASNDSGRAALRPRDKGAVK